VLFNLARALGSLTASPIATALDQARRQARRLEAGGAAASGRVGDSTGGGDFALPADIDPVAVATAI